jgi:ferric-dicitrate binding protein FerR (iron transport regulator)
VKDKREAVAAAEASCQRLGDLAGLAAPVDARAPGAEQWDEIERRLDRRGLLRRRLWPALAVCAVAVLCAGGWLVARRPLGYRVVDCTLAADGVFATTANREGAVAFDDGSRMSVEKGARFRLGMLPFGHGAEIHLDDGDARLAVVHRTGARWSVVAGPFRIDVTGTRFGVRWSRRLSRLHVTMLEGEVLVTGGAIPPATHLRAGQTLDADWTASTFAIANEQGSQSESRRGAVTSAALPAEPAKLDSTGPHGARPPLPTPRKRREAVAHGENPVGAAPPSALPAPSEPANNEPLAAPMVPQLLPPSPYALAPMEPSPTVAPKPASVHVVFDENGQLAHGLTGATWVASGEGTTFSAPAAWDSRSPLLPEAGLLCTSGTVAGLSCVNEGTPRILCNWDRNWGVAIGWNTRADKNAWGDEAMGAIVVEFRGRSASYRLNAHLKGDPSERIYCVENYKSGQVVRPSMFKSECWSGKGDTLADFTRVDLFNLQFSSGMSYVAFRYCISGITLYP